MKHKVKTKKVSSKKILAIIASSLIVAGLGYSAILSMIPVNASYPVFAAPENLYIKAIRSQTGKPTFATQSVKGGKNIPGVGAQDATYVVPKGGLVSLHIINEEKNLLDAKSLHNINIDEFNVHSNDLGYFQTQTITFLADKAGEFNYYCSIHPEMRGIIEVR